MGFRPTRNMCLICKTSLQCVGSKRGFSTVARFITLFAMSHDPPSIAYLRALEVYVFFQLCNFRVKCSFELLGSSLNQGPA